MSKRRIMSIVGLCLNVLLIVCLFIPMFSGSSMWDMFSKTYVHYEVVLLISLIIGSLLLVLQICGVLKDTKLVMLPVGFFITFNLSYLFAGFEHGMDGFDFGFYISLITSIAEVIVLGIGGLLSNESKPKVYGYGPRPVGYDPKTGQPIYETPKQIVGYDPKTGQPIYQ